MYTIYIYTYITVTNQVTVDKDNIRNVGFYSVSKCFIAQDDLMKFQYNFKAQSLR
jgi:hypothetical protein